MNDKIIIPIKGMHCKSCELLVEDSLSEISGVKKSVVDFRKGLAEIYYVQEKPALAEIEKAIAEAGYALGKDEDATWLSRNPQDYQDLGWALFVLIILALGFGSLGLTNFNFGDDANPASLGVVLLVGLLAGLSTCMALVGGLVLGISARHGEKHPEASVGQKFRPHLFFNLGRVGGYALLGAMLGLLGSAFQFSTFALGMATILVGFVMLVMGIKLLGIFPRFEKLGVALPKSVGKFFGSSKEIKEYSHQGAMLLGALTFFLPCGFTQTMQLLAISSGNPMQGALIMATFAVGTMPGLLGIGGLASLAKGVFARRFFKFAGLLVILFAFVNFSNGYNLTGWQFGSVLKNESVSSAEKSASFGVKQQTEKGNQQPKELQVLETTYTYQADIQPSSFTVKVDQPVKFLVKVKENGLGCMSTITLPGLNKDVYQLVAGKNIEMNFTPTKKGVYKITCAMGVPRGTITVE